MPESEPNLNLEEWQELDEQRSEIADLTSGWVEEKIKGGEATVEIIDDITNGHFRKSENEMWMALKHGKTGGRWELPVIRLGWRTALHNIRQFMSGDKENSKISQFLGAHKSKIKFWGGATAVTAGIIMGAPAIAAVGGAYLVRGGIEGIKKRMRGKTEGKVGEEKVALGMDEQIKMGLEAKIFFAEELACEVEKLAREGSDKTELYFNKMSELIDFLHQSSRQNVEIEYYQDEDKEVHARVSGSETEGTAVAKINLGELMKKSIKSDLVFGLLEAGGGLAGGVSTGALSVIHGVEKAGAIGVSFSPGSFEAVNIAKDSPPMADYHNLVKAASGIIKFARTAAEQVPFGTSTLGHIPQQEIAQRAFDLINGLNKSVAVYGLFATAETAMMIPKHQGAEAGKLTQEQKDLDAELKQAQEFYKKTVLELQKIEEEKIQKKEETKEAPAHGDWFDLSPLELAPGEPTILMITGQNSDGSLEIDYYKDLDDNTAMRHERLSPEDFKNSLKKSDKEAIRIARSGEMLPEHKAFLESTTTQALIKQIQDTLSQGKSPKIKFNPNSGFNGTYYVDSLKLDGIKPTIRIETIENAKRGYETRTIKDLFPYIQKIEPKERT